MKNLSAIVLAVALLAVPGGGVLAAANGIGPEVSSSPAAFEATSIYGASAYSGYPTIAIASVVQGTSVTVLGSNFPPNDTFWVRMNYMGTKGVSGTIVETVTTDASGNLSDTTYSIPSALQNEYKVAIRLISPDTGYFAYNWFYNNTTTSGSSSGSTSSSTYSGYPTFSISAVQQDTNVTISPSNFPPNDEFYVRLNWMGTQGISGHVVQIVTTDANGALNDTVYYIPDFLKGSYKIAIRLESPTSGLYAYNWFYNNDAP